VTVDFELEVRDSDGIHVAVMAFQSVDVKFLAIPCSAFEVCFMVKDYSMRAETMAEDYGSLTNKLVLDYVDKRRVI
jgi:hypothetical protein